MADLLSANAVSRLSIICEMSIILCRRASAGFEGSSESDFQPETFESHPTFYREDDVDLLALTTQLLLPLSLLAYGPRGLKFGSRMIPPMIELEDPSALVHPGVAMTYNSIPAK